eukprot:5973026-Lingulodinium_polyedra.AAC.1
MARAPTADNLSTCSRTRRKVENRLSERATRTATTNVLAQMRARGAGLKTLLVELMPRAAAVR